jgi:ABC-type sugar transport system ATPase subunit
MEPLLQLTAVEKSFPGVRALRPLDLALAPGGALGVVGENGAGKSTLIRVLSGVHRPDSGEIRWRGAPARFRSPRDAFEAGIATIHQELAYFGRLSVAENLCLGETWPRYRWGGVSWRRLHDEARRRLDSFGLPVETTRRFDTLSTAEKQEVAMARALSRKSRLLILDEPTASLTGREVDRLFSHLRRARDAGVSVIYISHRLEEVLELTDEVIVLRDGEKVAAYPTRRTDAAGLVRDMVGREIQGEYPDTRSRSAGQGEAGPVALEVEGLTRSGLFRDVSFQVRRGEVLGLAGLVGAGRSEVARAIYGLYPVDRGSMRLRGAEWAPAGPRDALRRGLVYLPEERKRQALVMDHDVGESIGIGFTDLLARCGLIPRRLERRRLEAAVEKHRVRATGLSQAIGTLSGGNQQKAVLARWLEREPEVLLLDEPTRGVDVAAKSEIHAMIDSIAAAGKAVVLISSDLPEVLGMSDRVVVMREGTVVRELSGGEKTRANVLLAASGVAGMGC